MVIKKHISLLIVTIILINPFTGSAITRGILDTLISDLPEYLYEDNPLITRAAPVAANFTNAEICKGTSFQGSLTGLASGGTPPYTTYTITTAASQGTLSLTAATGLFTYTAPATPASTTTTFKWDVKDSASLTSNIATYTIPVGFTVNSQSVAGCIGSAITGTLTATGGTPPYTFSIVTQPADGVVTLSGTGNASFTYTSNALTEGLNDSFTFNATDSASCVSNNTNTVTVHVGAVSGSFTVTPNICTGGTVSSTVAGHGIIDTPPLTYIIVTQPAQGTLTLASNFTSTGNFTYTSNSPFLGFSDGFDYQFQDANGCLSNISAATIGVGAAICIGANTNCVNLVTVNTLSGCPGQAVQSTLFEQTTGGPVGGTPPYNFQIVTPPGQGQLILSPNFTFNGDYTYIPNNPFVGTSDSFTYTITDSNGCTSNNIATTAITINLSATSFSLSGACVGSAFSGTVFQKASGGVVPYTYFINTNPLQGTLTLDPNFINNGKFTYTANPAFVGTTDSFTFFVRGSNNCASSPATVTLTITQFSSIGTGNTTAPICPGKTLTGNLSKLFTGGTPPYTFTAVTQPTQGVLNLSGNGSFTYTPNSPFRGTQDGFKFRFTDANGCLSSIQTLIIPIGLIVSNVTTSNVCPNTSLTSTLAGSNILTVTGTPPYTFSQVTTTSNGSLVLSPTSGIFTYTPNVTFLGPSDSFTYQVTDTTGCLSNIATVTLPIGLIPLLNLQTSAVCQGSSVTSSVTGGGSGGTGPYTFTIIDGPTQGFLTLSANFSTNGQFTYFPNRSFTGTSDSFIYEIVDANHCASNATTVTIPIKQSPSAFSPATQVLCSGQTVSNTLAGNASGGSGIYTYKIINNPMHGTLTQLSGFSANGNYSYSSTSPYSGLDCFTYQVTDSNGCTSAITPVDFTINGNPVITSQNTAAICQGGTLSGSVSSFVTGGTGIYTYILASSPSHANSFSFNNNGTFSYTPNPLFAGPSDSFSFSVTDTNGCASNTATATIPINANPVTTNSTLSSDCQNTPFTSTLSSFVSAGTPPYTYAIISGPLHGTINLSGSTGSFTYNPTASFTGPSDSFTFQVTDSSSTHCISNISTITIPVTPNPIAANKTEAVICQGTSFNDTLSSLITTGTPPYTYAIVNNSINGATVNLSPTAGTFTYSAGASFTGPTDSFTFDVTDNNGCISNTATIFVPINQNPVASNGTTSTVSPNGTISGTLTGLINFGLTPYSYMIVSGVSHGTLIPNPANFTATGNFTYMADATTNSDSFTFQVTDSNGCVSNTANETIPRTGAPTAQSSTTSAICQGTTLQINLTTSVTGGVAPYTYNVNQPTYGTLSPSASTGTYTYFANATFAGPSDSFTYSITDHDGSMSNMATITIPINPNPIGTNLTGMGTCENIAISGSVVSQISGGTDMYTFTLVTPPAHSSSFSFATGGTYTYTPVNNFTGFDSFTFNATDIKGCQSNVTTLIIPVFPDPVATNLTVPIICQGGSFNSSVSSQVSGGTPPYMFAIVTPSVHGAQINLNPTAGAFQYTGNFSYTGNQGFTGPDDMFTFNATDNNGCISDTATVIIPIDSNPITSSGSTTAICQATSITYSLSNNASGGTGAYTYTIVSQPSQGGTVSFSGSNGQIVYTAPLSFTGPGDSFTFSVTDQDGCSSNIATITVPINANPISPNTTVSSICQGTSYSGTLTNSSGLPPYKFAIQRPPTFGRLTLSANFITSGQYTYTASSSFTGPSDSFTYNTQDSNNCVSNTGTITIPINPNPSAANATESSICQGSNFMGTLSNLVTGGTGSYTYTEITQSDPQATVVINPTSGVFMYSASQSFTGPQATFMYQVSDSDSCQSTIATITIPITPDPIASNKTESAICPGNSIVDSLAPLVSDGTGPLTFAIVSPPNQGGTVVLNPTSGIFTYTSNPNFPGPTEQFTYNATDSLGCTSNTATITININAPPVTNNNTEPSTCLGVLISDTLSSFVSGGAQPYIYQITAGPFNGTLAFSPTSGNFTYTSNVTFAGIADDFNYQVTDSNGCVSNNSTITLPVTSTPITEDFTEPALCQGFSFSDDLSLFVSGGTTPYTYDLVSGPSQAASFSLDSSTGNFVYNSSLNFTGPSDSFTYNVTGSNGCTSNTSTITIPISPAPVGINQTFNAIPGQPLIGQLLASGGVPPYTFAAALPNPTQGTLIISPSGSFIYTPFSSASGQDSFGFSVSDSSTCVKSRAPYGGLITIIIPSLNPIDDFFNIIIGDTCPI